MIAKKLPVKPIQLIYFNEGVWQGAGKVTKPRSFTLTLIYSSSCIKRH